MIACLNCYLLAWFIGVLGSLLGWFGWLAGWLGGCLVSLCLRWLAGVLLDWLVIELVGLVVGWFPGGLVICSVAFWADRLLGRCLSGCWVWLLCLVVRHPRTGQGWLFGWSFPGWLLGCLVRGCFFVGWLVGELVN